MTVELYRYDPYRLDFRARVIERHDMWVGVDQTCFWAGEVGGLRDGGSLGGLRVCEVRRVGSGVVFHRVIPVAGERLPDAGDCVMGVVDWEPRYAIMRFHSARFLVDLALRSTHDLAGLAPSRSADGSFEFSVVLNSGDYDGAAVAGWIDAVVADDLPIHVGDDPSRVGGCIWHLDGLGHRPCSGLAVYSTGEVGVVHVHRVTSRGVRLQLRLEVGDSVGLARQPP